MNLHGSRRDYAAIVVSLALAGIFAYAGVDKIHDPLQFADSIAAFSILPATFISPLALALPLFEIQCGVLLLVPRTRRVASMAIGLTSMVFFGVLLSALLRGLTIDCGCFGAGTPSRSRMWLELGLNVLLIGGASFVYLRSMRRLSRQTAEGPA